MAEHLISTPATLDTCRRCGTPILTCHTDGIPVRATATPITPQAELAALLDGRATYDVHPLGVPRRPYLVWRHAWKIQAGRKYPVVAAHTCPPGPHFPPPPKPAIKLYVPYGTENLPENPPF